MVNVYPRWIYVSWPTKIAASAALALAFYIDTKYIRMTMNESDMFVDKSGIYGDWRARQQRSKLPVDSETLGE